MSTPLLQLRIGTNHERCSLLPSWELALDSANKSPKTIKDYAASVRSLAKFLREHRACPTTPKR